ncbi:MAG: mechanosensitive ion channel, partial [Candidatus Eremiobacteraeota bacterium]|nr:mechanosensitive ion channel [Candidatus Eremiobacteraeota bacterium]
GSLTVLLDRPFSVGDWVVVDGVEGVVEDVGFRSTRIRTFYDSVISLPNSRLITAHVDNYGARTYRRYTTKLNLLYSTSPDRLEAFCEGIRELGRVHPSTRKDSFQVWVNDMSEYSLQVLVYVFWKCPDWESELRERHRFLVDVHRLARSLEVEFAYPTSKVHLDREGPELGSPELTRESEESAHQQGRELVGALTAASLPESAD